MNRFTYNIFAGRITKHHLVQILPVAIKARFCVNDNFSAGLKKSLAPAKTTPHFITGALFITSPLALVLFPSYIWPFPSFSVAQHTRNAPS